MRYSNQVDELLSISWGECEMESGYVPEVMKSYFAEVIDVGLQG